ncbi:MAG: alanine racemase, partial [Rhodospirillales bacterium]|nr:alanine racemase [Rhodospirillales bacterium]
MNSIDEIDTPAVIVDLDVTESNIRRFQEYCDRNDLHLRPHIKTHKIPAIAAAQVTAGAVGINCQKISEAEVMADAGITDILITYNILGAEKLARLHRVAERCDLTVTVDNAHVVKGLSDTIKGADHPLRVLVECDTGAGRCGVQTPEAARDLAREITAADGLSFRGLMTYPSAGSNIEADDWLAKAKTLCEDSGLPCTVVSSGGTPDMWRAGELSNVTEYRVGTYVYNDRSLVSRGVCTFAQCALTVLSTVVSRPTADRAVLDAGSKSLT